MSRRFHNAHHHRSLRQQLVVVWDRLLIAEPEGPALISLAVTYLLSMLVLRTHDGRHIWKPKHVRLLLPSVSLTGSIALELALAQHHQCMRGMHI
jgi:hypothetical protein